MKSYSNIAALWMIYHAYFYSLMRYGIVFWGNWLEAKKIFLLQKKTIRIMMGMKHREPYRPAFTKLNISTLASKYILSLMIFMINNREHFTFNYSFYKRSTRYGRNLHVLQSHLVVRQKVVHCMSIKIFNSQPDYLIDLVHDKIQFIKEIKDVLIHNLSYTVDECLLFCRDQQLRNRNGVHTA
jgi:hypothetical protein